MLVLGFVREQHRADRGCHLQGKELLGLTGETSQNGIDMFAVCSYALQLVPDDLNDHVCCLTWRR